MLTRNSFKLFALQRVWRGQFACQNACSIGLELNQILGREGHVQAVDMSS